MRGLVGAVLAMAASALFTWAVTRWVVVREWRRFNLRLEWRESLSEWRVLLNFSLPTFVTMLMLGPVTWACNAFLANQPNGYAELGVFNAAFQWQAAIQYLPTVICTAMIPVMSEKCGTGDVSSSLRIMKRMVRLIALVVFPVAVVLSAASPWIMHGYGATFAAGHWTMVLLVATGSLTGIMTPIGNFVTAQGAMWRGLSFCLGWVAAMLVGSWFMVRWGAEGLAGARLIAIVVHLILVYSFVRTFRSSPPGRGPVQVAGGIG